MISKEAKEKISRIKELQEKNHIKNFMVWNTFHNKYKKQSRPFSTSTGKDFQINDKIFYSRLRNKNAQIYQNKDKNNERILSLYSDYTCYNPYVTMMMTNGASATEYNHKKYIQTESSIPPIDLNKKVTKIKNGKKVKKYFGIDGDTPLETHGRDTKHYGRTTLTELYTTTSLGMKTMTNFPSKLSPNRIFNKTANKFNTSNLNNYANIPENDIKTAGDLFLDAYRSKNRKVVSKESKKIFFQDYNIVKTLTEDEENKIDKIINQNVKNNLNCYPIFREINSEDKTGINTHIVKLEFKDPYNSLKKIKVNGQMLSTIEKINLNLQWQKFQKEYDSICELNMQKNRMPNVRVISKKKLKTFHDLKTQKYLKLFESNDQPEEKSKKKKSKAKKEDDKIIDVHYDKPQNRFTRSDTLNHLKIKVDYACFIFHPELRSMYSVCFDDDKGVIYIHGGLGGKKLADIWAFLLTPGKIGWHKLYKPSPNEDYDAVPLPRFGHTMHFYNDKLYVIGGEFRDWPNNTTNEGIMCIYDTVKNSWDMLKDKYDFAAYQRKKAEKAMMKREILSYQEIAKAMENNEENNENKNSQKDQNVNPVNTNEIQNKNNDNSKNKASKKNNNKNKKLLLNKNKITISKQNKVFPPSIKLHTKKEKENLSESKKEKEKAEENINQFPCLRRNHISLVIGTNLFIYGGINQSKICLNDCWIYDLIKNEWSILEFTGRFPPPLFSHCACLALESSQLLGENLTIYHKPVSSRKTLPLLKCDGVFFFGGYNDNKIPTNLFFRMIIGIKPVIFEIPEIGGIPPTPRIEASMNFYSENNMLIIHGGRNDIKNELYNDIVLLDMETMNWIHPQFNGDPPLQRSEHKSVIISSKLFIFGGTTGENLINFDFTIFDLDFFRPNYMQNINIS